MASNDAQALADAVLPLMKAAGDVIMHHYASVDSLEVHTKADHTPLTAADLAAHDVIVQGLHKLTPDIPVLSEEADMPPAEVRRRWPRVWLVDPLDGTREFIDASGQFCINVALIENGVATMGMIYSPVLKMSWLGIHDAGAWRIDASERCLLSCRTMADSPVLISSSRRFTPDMLACEQGLRNHFGRVERLSQGSAMKFCRVADGEADIYPCFGPTSEWDTAAGQVIVEAAGGMMLSLDYKPFRYNQRDTLLNGGFFLLADRNFDWLPVLRKATAG
ncbi:MAG: 3'(2'),5'-bisphosphate nucleotidase CysQ [Pseudomonadales bacterium]